MRLVDYPQRTAIRALCRLVVADPDCLHDEIDDFSRLAAPPNSRSAAMIGQKKRMNFGPTVTEPSLAHLPKATIGTPFGYRPPAGDGTRPSLGAGERPLDDLRRRGLGRNRFPMKVRAVRDVSGHHTVELLGAYSNQTNVRRELCRLVDLPADRPADEGIRQPRQRQHRLRAAEVQDLIDADRAGNSVYVLAKAFTIDRRTVSAILERHGVSRRYNLLDTRAIAEAARLYEAGWSLARLGDHFGVTARTVQNAFVKAEIPRRPVGTNQWTTPT